MSEASPWKPIASGPKDGSFVLLTAVDEDGTYGIRQGYFEKAPADRRWYDIDGEPIEPEFWMKMPPPPPGAAA
jgi:hypothetical protein